MEGFGTATVSDPLHFCHWRQPDRLYRAEIISLFDNRTKLAMDIAVYPARDDAMAAGRFAGEHSLWPVPVFYGVFEEDRQEDGVGEGRKGSRRQEVGSKKRKG